MVGSLLRRVIAPALLIPALSSGAFSADREYSPMEKLQKNLAESVHHLSAKIGTRSYRDTAKLDAAAEYIERTLLSYGYAVRKQPFEYNGVTYHNVVAEKTGTDPGDGEILVVGAHYDTVAGTPGADDNASGVAGLLELARLTAERPMKRTVHFVAFCLEEPPVFMTRHMGSYAYAKSLRDGHAKVHGMISLEMIGFYCEAKGCQMYPPVLRWFYPDRGDFIAFVGNISSRSFTNSVKRSFAAVSGLPVESLNGISLIPGVNFSDHQSFWKFGYPAFMITDTSFYRNPNYHDFGDTAETLDYGKMADLISGLYRALSGL